MSAPLNLGSLNRNESGKPRQNPELARTLSLVPQPGKALFADSLLETTGGQRRRRMWAMIFSSVLQCLVIATCVVLSLWYTEVLPRQELITLLSSPPPPPPAAPPPPPASTAPKNPRAVSSLINGKLIAPSSIPSKILILKEKEPEPFSSGGLGVVGGVPGGTLGGVVGGILNSVPKPRVTLQSAPPTPQRVVISQGVTEGMLLSKVQPVYPPIAVAARTEGIVTLKAIIAKDGTIKNLQVLSGHPMLVPAAIDAVQRWRYRPYLLNGEPVEVETTIQVIFTLSQ